MSSLLPPHFECYLKGFVHNLFQQGYDEQDAGEELYKLTGEEFFTAEQIKEFYQVLRDGRYLVNVRADEVKPEPEKGWLSRVASWAYTYFRHQEEEEKPLLTPYLEPAPSNETVVNNLAMVIGPDWLEVAVDYTRRVYKNNGTDCMVTCGLEDTVIQNERFLNVASRDLMELFKNDLRILNWSIVPYHSRFAENPLFSENQLEIFKTIDQIFRFIGHHQRVEKFHLNTNRMIEMKYFIPYLWPRILKSIKIETRVSDLTPQEESLLESDQVKCADHLEFGQINCDWFKLSKCFCKCKTAKIHQKAPIDLAGYSEVVCALLKNPKLEKLTIQVESVEAILQAFEITETADGVIREWKEFDYESDRHKGKTLRSNIDKKCLTFTGPEYKEPPMTLFV
ncbi:unnamed protein product [Caenorhabditis brenneri]